jgi:large subunit ribosomal protein L10
MPIWAESLCQQLSEAKTFYLKGGESTLAISKQHKDELVDQYVDWANRSQAMFVTEYLGLTMKQIDELRVKLRDLDGEFHIVKNTLGKIAFERANLATPEKFLAGSTAVVFAFGKVPETAKVISELSRDLEFVKIKGGYLDKQLISASEIKALADLPPLPVVRAQLLGTIMAPANKLARTLIEPARQVAAVLKAYADQEAASVAA